MFVSVWSAATDTHTILTYGEYISMSNTLQERVFAAMDTLAEVVTIIESGAVPPAEEEAAKKEPTPKEISENVSGNPNLYKDNPELYNKMAKFYNPLKQPFTADTWMTTGLLGYGSTPRIDADGFLKDPRPYKIVEKDGKPYQRSGPMAGPDWYWIGLGVSDVTAPEWNKQEIVHDTPREVRLEKIRNYKGGLRSPSLAGWPEKERDAYLETH